MFHNIHSWLGLRWTVFLHFRQLQFLVLWDVGTLKLCTSHLLPESHMPPTMQIFCSGTCQLMLGTSHFLPLMLLQSVTALVALGSVGGHVPLRAALISLLEGRFGSSLGNLYWRAGHCFMSVSAGESRASPMEALSWQELACAVLLVRKSRWQGKFNGIS